MKASLSGLLCFLLLISAGRTQAFTSSIRFSNEFYAAQKFFFSEAVKKYPKLAKDKFYPEVPIRGIATNEELKSIQPLLDFFEARRVFSKEVLDYPEQLFPEIFSFLYNHPALQVNPSSRAKFDAIELYFLPFNFLFCPDKNYYFHPNVKTNPCPLVFCYSDDRKISTGISLSSSLKVNLNLLISENLLNDYLSFQGKRPVSLKGGGSQSVKFQVNVRKLKSDSAFHVMPVILNDPSQPKIKIMASVILLPGKEFLKLPAHFYNVNYQYTSHLKNIDLYSDRTSGPERCSGNNCSGNLHVNLRKSDRQMTQYSFGENGTVQFNLSTQSPEYSSKSNALHLQLNEMGSLQGKARDCPGQIPASSAPCPAESANNGKQLYGSRKLEMNFFIPESKTYNCLVHLEYKDLKLQLHHNPELSWLENKKLLLLVKDSKGQVLHKEILNQPKLNCSIKNLSSGNYTLSVYPITEDSKKENPSFEINFLNQAGRARFDFELKGDFVLVSSK